MADFDSEFFIDYSSLDDFQRQLIDRKNNKSMVVSGSAGSGKSLIALHKAKQIAALDESYTIIVYTKSLRKYFEDGLKKLGLRNVYHYHQWKHNQRHVKYLIVDECQDFTKEEIEEMKQYGEYCLFFGDSAQSIMGFGNRGNVQSIERTASDMGIAPDEGTEKVSIFKDQNGKCLRFITSPSTDRLSKAMLDRKRRVKLRFLRH